MDGDAELGGRAPHEGGITRRLSGARLPLRRHEELDRPTTDPEARILTWLRVRHMLHADQRKQVEEALQNSR